MVTKRLSPLSVALGVIGLISIMSILSVSSMVRKSVTYDELGHHRFGRKLLEGRLKAADMQRMPVSALNALPLHVLRRLKITSSKRMGLLISRIPTTIAALLLAYFIFHWASSLYGPKAGLVAVMCCVFCPTILAHSRFVTNDVFCGLLMFVSTYAFLKYLNSPSLLRWILSAVLFSLAQLTKQTALLLVPIFPILFALYRRAEIARAFGFKDLKWTMNRIGSGLCLILIFALIFVVILNAGYGFKGIFVTLSQLAEHNPGVFSEPLAQKLVQMFPYTPLPFPKVYLETLFLGHHYNSNGFGHGPIYLLGKLSQKGWWYYFPVAVVLKFPISFFLLFGWAVFTWTKKRNKREKLAGLSLLIPPLIIFLFFTLFCTAQIGIRLLLPMLPFLYVFISQIVTQEARKMKFAYRLGIPLLFFWFVVSSLSFYPHYLSYFNELIGRRINMYRYLADSNVDWGQNQEYLDKYTRDNPGKNIKVVPPRPTSGRVIINVNELVGVTEDPKKYRWLRTRYRPVDHIAYSWLIFDIPE